MLHATEAGSGAAAAERIKLDPLKVGKLPLSTGSARRPRMKARCQRSVGAQVCRHFARRLLAEQPRWPLPEFLARWRSALPEARCPHSLSTKYCNMPAVMPRACRGGQSRALAAAGACLLMLML